MKRHSRSKFGLRIGCVAALGFALILGCGSEEYQERLDTTAKYFASIELQNSHLHGAWTDAQTTISLRLPLQFVELPPPEGPTAEVSGQTMLPTNNVAETADEEMEEEEDEEPATQGPKFGEARPAAKTTVEEDLPPDPRQPHFLTVPLPGIRGAFKASLSVVAENGRTAPGSGYVYVLSNHHLAGNLEAAGRFQSDVVATLSSALGLTVNPEQSRSITLPQRPDAFLKPVTYTELELEPTEQDGEMAREFGVATRFGLYSHNEGDVQIVVLFVLPRDLDNVERFPLRKTLSLETLRIDNPQLAKPGGSTTIGSPSGNAF